MLKPTFTRFLRSDSRRALERLHESARTKGNANPTIESIWATVDTARDGGTEAYGLRGHELTAASKLLLNAHHRIMDGFHRELEQAVSEFFAMPEWGTGTSESQLEDTTSFLSDPTMWIRAEARHLEGLGRAEALSALATEEPNPRAVSDALVAKHFTVGDAETHAQEIVNLLMQPLKGKYGDTRKREFHVRLQRARSRVGGHVLGDEYDKESSRIERILYRSHLMYSNDGRLSRVEGWLNTAVGLIRRLSHGDCVITTNYDLAVELAVLLLQKHGSGGVSSIDLGTPRWETTWHGGQPDAHLVSVTQGGFQYYKLHGSLGWTYCSSCETLSSSASHTSSEAGWPSSVDCCSRRSPLRLMVPPRLEKTYDDAPLKDIWAKAEKVVSTAERIISAGHGWHAGDAQLHQLISRARATRTADPWQSVEFVNGPREDRELNTRVEHTFGQVATWTGQWANQYFKFISSQPSGTSSRPRQQLGKNPE